MARRSGTGNGKNQKSQAGRLRIVAGNWRSRVLDVADVPGLRPTSERIRETLFNWLAPTIDGARCLDLFAGTGALGLEALSRGASHVTFVEKSAKAVETLAANIATLGSDATRLVAGDAGEFVARSAEQRFDVIFLDPPFADNGLEDICRLVDAQDLLASGGKVYLEQDRGAEEPRLPAGWEVTRSKTAGNVRYSLVTRRNGENDE